MRKWCYGYFREWPPFLKVTRPSEAGPFAVANRGILVGWRSLRLGERCPKTATRNLLPKKSLATPALPPLHRASTRPEPPVAQHTPSKNSINCRLFLIDDSLRVTRKVFLAKVFSRPKTGLSAAWDGGDAHGSGSEITQPERLPPYKSLAPCHGTSDTKARPAIQKSRPHGAHTHVYERSKPIETNERRLPVD